MYYLTALFLCVCQGYLPLLYLKTIHVCTEVRVIPSYLDLSMIFVKVMKGSMAHAYTQTY